MENYQFILNDQQSANVTFNFFSKPANGVDASADEKRIDILLTGSYADTMVHVGINFIPDMIRKISKRWIDC